MKTRIATITTLVSFVLVALSMSPRAVAQDTWNFSDVDTAHWARPFVASLAFAGVTSGCGNGMYCPDDLVTRAQMATFLERGMRGGDYAPPPATGIVFSDVGAKDFSASYIEQLYRDGITGGCGGSNYCPSASVTRAQMAVFLLRAKHGGSFVPPPASGGFADVGTSHWAAAWIEQLASEGITSGCGGNNYCPEEPVTRAQMAVFLVKAFDLPKAPRPLNAPVLYFVTSSSNSDYLPDYDITLKSNTYTIISLNTETDESEIVYESYRPSWGGDARIAPYTVGDRLFVQDEWESFDSIGHHEYRELDPNTHELMVHTLFRASNPYYLHDGCRAVVGDVYFYRSHRTYDAFFGDKHGDFRKLDIETGSDEILFPYGTRGLDMCQGNLWSDNGRLYDATNVVYDEDAKIYFAVFARDLATGAALLDSSVAVEADDTKYHTVYSAVSNGVAFIVRIAHDNLIEIWSAEFVDGTHNQAPKLIYSGSLGNMTSPNSFDVDDGFIAIGSSSEQQVFLYDSTRGTSQSWAIPFSHYFLQVLHVYD
jgi:hypothetical protein